MMEPRLRTERRRALALLATAGRDGLTQPLLTTLGFDASVIADLVNEGLATARVFRRQSCPYRPILLGPALLSSSLQSTLGRPHHPDLHRLSICGPTPSFVEGIDQRATVLAERVTKRTTF